MFCLPIDARAFPFREKELTLAVGWRASGVLNADADADLAKSPKSISNPLRCILMM